MEVFIDHKNPLNNTSVGFMILSLLNRVFLNTFCHWKFSFMCVCVYLKTISFYEATSQKNDIMDFGYSGGRVRGG